MNGGKSGDSFVATMGCDNGAWMDGKTVAYPNLDGFSYVESVEAIDPLSDNLPRTFYRDAMAS